MIYWMKRNKGGSGIPDSVSIMSKSEILREIVTEKLTTAAQEIFAVVERTVAGYEEEASGLRQEIDRQRRQLEAVLQPRVKLQSREDLIPLVEGHETVVSLEEEEEEQTQQSDVEVSMSPGPWDDDDDANANEDDEEGDRGEEEQQLSAPPAKSPRREDLKDPAFQMKLRKRVSKPQIGGTQSHIEFKIRMLEDSQISMFSISALYNLPVQQLQCPRGLQEKDFLDLLRSTFPRLADQRQFDFCTFGRSRKPQPLRVKTLTPEEIYKRLIEARKTYLFLLLKTGEDPQSSSEDLHPVERRDDSPSSSASKSADQPQMNPRSQNRRRSKRQISDTLSHIALKIRLLEDSKWNMFSKAGLYNLPVQQLQCPRGLQEKDFLDLLRSSLPQLTDQKQLDFCTYGRSMQLLPLRVKTLTPEEIYKQLIKARKTYLFLHLKDPQSSSEDPVDDSPSSSASTSADETEMNPSSSTSQHQNMETEEAEDEDAAESQVDSSNDNDKDGDEAFDGDDDWKPDPELQSPKKKRRKKESKLSGVKGQSIGSSKTACKVCGVWYRNLGSLINHALSHVEKSKLVCGVCGEQFESVEELKGHLRNYQKSYECSYCGKSFLTITGLNSHTTVHTGDRPFKCDVCHKTFGRLSILSAHRWVHVPDKPHKCDICPKAFGLKTQLKAHSKMHAGSTTKYHCNICGKSLADWRSLTCHKLIHSGERRYGCKVCGKRFKLPKTLKAHEKVHSSRDRPYLCNICCKTFVTNQRLTAHMLTHSNERPFTCSVCSKGFVSNGDLNVHMRVHTGESPYSCSECGRGFKQKFHLNSHVRTHLVKRFVCGVCGKAFTRKNHLASHMRSHNGKRPYRCTVCKKTFTQGHCLKTHMKSHQGEENPK